MGFLEQVFKGKGAGLEKYMQSTKYYWGHARAYVVEKIYNEEEYDFTIKKGAFE